MTRRMFPNDPVRITFTKDFQQLSHGDLLPGRTVTLVYDAERLPNERSEGWVIRAYYRFADQGAVEPVQLWSETGVILSKRDEQPGQGTMLIGTIDVAPAADYLAVWFLNTGKSGAQYWDSNFGRNYYFRFVVQDLHIDLVRVAPVPNVPLSTFHIDVAARPDVSEVSVPYRVMNDRSGRREERRLQLTPTESSQSAGKRMWSATTNVPADAVIQFSLAYTAAGIACHDTNSGKQYVTWTGSVPNREAGVL
jgi:Family of unknown function (DUF6209)